MDLSERIKIARERAGLSQEMLAEEINKRFRTKIKQQNISKMEKGAKRTSFIAQIAAVCGVRPEWLASEVGEMSLPSEINTGLYSEIDAALIQMLREEGVPKNSVLLTQNKRKRITDYLYNNVVSKNGTIDLEDIREKVRLLLALG